MSVIYTGAVDNGPDGSYTRYYSGTMNASVAGDFAIFALVKLQVTYLSDPQAGSPALISIGQNFTTGAGVAGGTGANDCYIRMYPANANSPSTSAGKFSARLAASAVSAAGAQLGSVKHAPGETVLVVLQSRSGMMELKTCVVGSGVVVTENSAPRNASYGSNKSLGTWRWGSSGNSTSPFIYQMAGQAAQSFSDAQILAIASGADLDTLVPVENRQRLWLFDRTDATIPATWGSVALARNGDWSAQKIGSPLVSNAPENITVSNEPKLYQSIGVASNLPESHTWTGTYNGSTPTMIQGRLERENGSVALDWTDLTTFSASSGTWTGKMSCPVGGPYFLQVRRKADPTVQWKSVSRWLACPVLMSMGQSPYVVFYYNFTNSEALRGSLFSVVDGGSQVIRMTTENTSVGMALTANAWHDITGGIPLMMLHSATGGTSSTEWANREAPWQKMLGQLDLSGAKAVLGSWLNGASEGAGSNPDPFVIVPYILANHTAILQHLDEDVQQARGVKVIGYRMLPHNRDTTNYVFGGRTRATQKKWAEDNANATPIKTSVGPWWADMMIDQETYVDVVASVDATHTRLSAGGPTNVGSQLELISGPGAGQRRSITALDGTTKEATLSSAWDVLPDATTKAVIYDAGAHGNSIASRNFGVRHGIDSAYHFKYTDMTAQGPTPIALVVPDGSNGTVADVYFQHKHGSRLRTLNGGFDAVGVAAFRAYEQPPSGNRVALTVTDARIVATDRVRITLASPPSSLSRLRVDYGWDAPVRDRDFWRVNNGGLGDLLYDDSGVAPTDGLPAYFTINQLAPGSAPIVVPPDPTPTPGVVSSAGFFSIT